MAFIKKPKAPSAARGKKKPAPRGAAARPAPRPASGTKPADKGSRGGQGGARPKLGAATRRVAAKPTPAAAKPASPSRKPAPRDASSRPATARRAASTIQPVPAPAAAKRRTRARVVKSAIAAAVAAVVETLGRVISPKSKPRTARRGGAGKQAITPSVEPPPEAARPALADEAFTFPESYGRTRVRLLMQSPGRLFVHWDLSPGVIEDLKAQLGRRAASLARLALRITTPDGGRPVLVLLPKGARGWYVDVPSHRQEYHAELGVMLPSGEFRSIATSNPLRLPRTSPSPVPARRKVEFSPEQPPESGSLGDLPEDVLSAEERAEWDAQSGSEHVVIDGEAEPGGSSELSGGAGRRRGRAGKRGDAPANDLGGASDLAPRGSSSDFRPRR